MALSVATKIILKDGYSTLVGQLYEAENVGLNYN